MQFGVFVSDGLREFISIVLFKNFLFFLVKESQLDFSVTQKNVSREEHNFITCCFSLYIDPNWEFATLWIPKVDLELSFFGFVCLPETQSSTLKSIVKMQKDVNTRG